MTDHASLMAFRAWLTKYVSQLPFDQEFLDKLIEDVSRNVSQALQQAEHPTRRGDNAREMMEAEDADVILPGAEFRRLMAELQAAQAELNALRRAAGPPMTDLKTLVEEARSLVIRLENTSIELGYEIPPEVTLPSNDDDERTHDELLLISAHALIKSSEMISRLADALEERGEETSRQGSVALVDGSEGSAAAEKSAPTNLREAVARIIDPRMWRLLDRQYVDPESMILGDARARSSLAKADQILALPPPDAPMAGWKMVPVEPTEAMISAGVAREWSISSDMLSPTPTQDYELSYSEETVIGAYRAMLSAAPSPEGEG